VFGLAHFGIKKKIKKELQHQKRPYKMDFETLAFIHLIFNIVTVMAVDLISPC
jgi:hypothetical protein